MLRPFLSYILVAITAIAQAGLPLHMHYCKGILESISVFISPGCGDHDQTNTIANCCSGAQQNHCSEKESNCCEDEVTVLLQEFDSLLPHFESWTLPQTNDFSGRQHDVFNKSSFVTPAGDQNFLSTGPPFYIRYNSLIFYA